MMKTYHGSCHCGAVHYEADIDLDAGSGKCNCSICTKRRAWGVSIKPDAFRLLSGADNVTDYQFGTMSVHHRFCRTCGVASYSDGYVEQIGGAFVAISVNCLDDADPTELATMPVHYSNGRDNAWRDAPAETRHL